MQLFKHSGHIAVDVLAAVTRMKAVQYKWKLRLHVGNHRQQEDFT